jgi:transposase
MMGNKSRMQGKDVSEQGSQGQSYVGIDVCESWLDVHVLPGGVSFRVANTKHGHRQLARRLATDPVALIVIEATGKWHRALHRSLHAHRHRVAVVNPLRARLFAEAIGVLAKTDRLDARMLALFAASLAPPARPPAPAAVEQLKELVQGRDSAVAAKTALENQLASAETAFLRRQLTRRLTRLATDIAALEREIERRIKAEASFARRAAILTSIPGIGPVVAATLLARLSELGGCSDKEIAMLAGLAPVADDSGRREGSRVIRCGPAAVRRVLYLAALTATRYNPTMTIFYERLVVAGKARKLALTAVARKLLVLANSLVSQDRLWTPTPPNAP